MKVSGGPSSVSASDVRHLVEEREKESVLSAASKYSTNRCLSSHSITLGFVEDVLTCKADLDPPPETFLMKS
jgi:hypothetical protein